MKEGLEKLKNLERFFAKLIAYLPLEDCRTCRLLNHKWKSRVDENVLFKIRMTDASLHKFKSPIGNSLRTKVLVEDLIGPVTKEHHKFLASIRELCLEKSVNPDDGDDDEDSSSSSSSSTRRKATIAFDNIITFLYQAYNVERLEINAGGLNHPEFSKYTFSNLSLALPRLKQLSIIVSGHEELTTLRRLFNQFFPNLDSVSVKYDDIFWAHSFESYLDVLLFILKHKATIKNVQLEEPPMAPRVKGRTDNIQNEFMTPFVVPSNHGQQQPNDNDEKASELPTAAASVNSSGEPMALASTYASYLKLFRDQFAQVKLEKLAVKFWKHKFSCWGLGVQLVESQKNVLVDVKLERMPGILVERLAWENSSTLRKLYIDGISEHVLPTLVSKNFNCSALRRCFHLEDLFVEGFKEILRIDCIPLNKLTSLVLFTYPKDSYLLENRPLCSYETAVKLCDGLVAAKKIVLSRASMITCELYRRFCKLPNLKQIFLVGFKGRPGNCENFVDRTRECLKSCKRLRVIPMPKSSKPCSQLSLCSSCVKIMFPSGPPASKSPWGTLPKNVRRQILSLLPREDLCASRLVSRQFCSDAQKSLLFGFVLSDKTKEFLSESSLRSIEYLAVGNLRNCVPAEKLYFARYVRTLVLEYNEEALLLDGENNNSAIPKSSDLSQEVFPRGDDDGGHDNNDSGHLTIEKAFGVGKEASIHPRNIVGLLGACYNLRALFFNQWALSNFFGSSRVSIKGKVFQNLAYRNLRCLHFVIHSLEVDAMVQFLALDYNSKVINLEKLSIEIVGAPKARSSLEIYEAIFKFVGNHDRTLTELRLVDHVFSSDYNSKVRNDIEPTLSTMGGSDKCRCCCIKILASIHLQKLTVIFKENSTKWNLGFVFLRAQRFLTQLWLEGLPLNEVHTVVLNSAETLESIFVSGMASVKKKSTSSSAFNFSYTKSCKRLRRLTVKNVEVENMQEMPESIQVLEINTLPSKNILWNISPSFNRIRGKATISQKIARNFFRRFHNLEKLALINLGCLSVELTRLLLQLQQLTLIVVSDISEDGRKELEGLKGVFVERINLPSGPHNNATASGGGVATKTGSKQQLQQMQNVANTASVKIKIDHSVFSHQVVMAL